MISGSPFVVNDDMLKPQSSFDDDATEMSSVSVRSSLSSSICSQSTVKKTVCFGQNDECIVYQNDISDLYASWYSKYEYQEIRQDFQMTLQDTVAQSEPVVNGPQQTYVQFIEDLYQSCCDDSMEQDDIAMHDASDNHIMKHQWRILAEDRYGLEKNACASLGDDILERRAEMSDAVLNIQHELSKHAELPADVGMDVIRDACENMSLPSRLFAQRIAEAHAAVVFDEAQWTHFWSYDFFLRFSLFEQTHLRQQNCSLPIDPKFSPLTNLQPSL